METTQDIQDILTARRDNRDGLTEFALRCANRAKRYAGEAGTVITHYLAGLAMDDLACTANAADPSDAVQAAISAAAHTIECAMRAGDVGTCEGVQGEQDLQSDDLAELFGSASNAAHHESWDGETPHA